MRRRCYTCSAGLEIQVLCCNLSSLSSRQGSDIRRGPSSERRNSGARCIQTVSRVKPLVSCATRINDDRKPIGSVLCSVRALRPSAELSGRLLSRNFIRQQSGWPGGVRFPAWLTAFYHYVQYCSGPHTLVTGTNFHV